MSTFNDDQPLSIRDTAKGIAVRAGILSVVALVVGTWLFSLAAKAASGLVKIIAGVLLLAIGGGFAAWQVKKVQRHLSDHPSQPALQ
jgi:protein-S-isoprenylcysteine O-methyltransferase Ste14